MGDFTGHYFPDLNSHKTFVRNDTQVAKKYYLDERGRLVAPNGTRYRLPSGPPEGRRPFQLDRSQIEKQSNRPHIPSWFNQKNLTRDSLFPEQQDANKLPEINFKKEIANRPSVPLDKIAHLNLTSVSKTSPVKISTSQTFSPSIYADLNPDLLQSVDWNVVLLTLILSSISFICNVTLLIFLSWKVCQVKGYHKSITTSVRLIETNPQSWHNPHCESHPGHPNRIETERSLPHDSLPKCHCVFEIAGLAGDPNLPQPPGLPGQDLSSLSQSWCTNRTSRSHHQSCHLKKYQSSKRKRKIKGPVDRSRLYHNRRARHRISNSWIENPSLGWLGRFNQIEKGSSSGGSWQMIASDGVISESTADEADSTPESTNNSDVMYEPNRMRMIRRKFHSHRRTPKADVICNTVSDSNLSQSQQQPSNHNGRNMVNDSDGRRYSNIGKGRANELYLEGDRESIAGISGTSPGLHPVTACRQNNYVCYTLGIHLGVLGALLSFIQILAICIALNQRIRNAGKITNQQEPATEIVCLIANSLAADTMMCARLYLIIAFVIVSLSALYINWISPILHSLSWMCDLQPIRFCFFTNRVNCLDQNSVGKQIRHQQNFAFIALMHSLPWASAAGTALLIAFSFFTKQSDSALEEFHTNKPAVNILFDGLNSLMSCSMKTSGGNHITLDLGNEELGIKSVNNTYSMTTASTLTTVPSKMNQEPTILQWVYPFLFIIIPVCLQLLFLLIYFIFIYRIKYRIRTISTSLRQFIAHKPLTFIVLLVLTETLSSGIPVLKSFFPSIYLNQPKSMQNVLSRLIIMHLLVDPWLIGGILQVIFKIDRVNDDCTNFDQNYLKSPRTLSTSNKNIETLKERKSLNDIHPISNIASLENSTHFKPEQPMNLLSCFPLATQTPMAEGGQSIGNRNFQPLLMSCLPTSGIFVSALNPNASSNTGHDAKSYQDINSPGFLYPITDSTLKISPTLNTGIYHANFQDLNMESTLKSEAPFTLTRPTEPPSIIPLSIRNPNSTQPNDLGHEHGALNTTVQDIYPQLCQHHQRMLEQQQNQQHTERANAGTMSRRARNFGSVPRFNQIPLNFTHSTNSVKPMQECETAVNASKSNNTATTTTTSTNAVAPSHSPSTSAIESGSFHRTLTGKSTATAAVMAAAAAAVAAQAGSLPRALSHPTPTSSDNHETFPTDSVNMPPSPPLCDIVPKNSDLIDSVRKRLSNHTNEETNQIVTE